MHQKSPYNTNYHTFAICLYGILLYPHTWPQHQRSTHQYLTRIIQRTPSNCNNKYTSAGHVSTHTVMCADALTHTEPYIQHAPHNVTLHLEQNESLQWLTFCSHATHIWYIAVSRLVHQTDSRRRLVART